MPDQYVYAALQRLELAKAAPPAAVRRGRHCLEPHALDDRIPQLIPWNDVGNGSIFNHLPVDT